MKFVFRADATSKIGTGHVMRCIALAQACLDAGNEVIFVLATVTPTLETRLKLEGMEVVYLSQQMGSIEDAYATADLASQLSANWIILDGYDFDGEYQRIIKEFGIHLLFIDDYGHANYYWADVVLNQNVYAHDGLYPNREPSTQLMLGSDYILLRREFWRWRGWRRETVPIARKLLVTMGGSDPHNVTLNAIQALEQVEVKEMEIVVVVGGSNPYYEQILQASQNSQATIRLQWNVTNMPELMSWADVAITSGGSTTWEMAFMGLPCLALSVVESQRQNVGTLSNIKTLENLGWYEGISATKMAEALSRLLMIPQERLQMTQRGQELVDGQGAVRVLRQIFCT